MENSNSTMAARLTSPLLSKRLSCIVAFASSVVPHAPPASHRQSSGSTSSSQIRPKKRATPVPAAAPRLRRTLSMPRGERDLVFEIFFHIPGFSELQRLRVHRSLSLISLQAMLQREFGVPFEDQRLYFQGDLLEGDEELASYEIQDSSVINVRISERYRRIGDVFTKIKVIRFPVAQAADAARGTNLLHDDYELVEVVAALPPLPIVLRRLGIAIAYITMLDRMQQKRTHRRVWREHVDFEEEPVSALDTTKHSSTTPLAAATAQLPSRSAADVRHIRKWLRSVKYFANANMPEPALHEIARSCVYEWHKAGDFIFRQGDVGDFFYILISGYVSLAAYGNGYFATMTPGMCFGEISLFEARGVRTASANVNFATSSAELAVLSGDVYRRVIYPHKQTVLHRAEKAMYSVPQLRLLPDHIITHIAYASKCLTAKTGKRLIRHGDEVNVLVLLIAGAVKVSTPRAKHQSCSGGSVAKFKPCFDQERAEKPYPIVSVIHAPAVFGQEGCLTNTRRAAPWDIDALDTCSLICLRMDTVSVFLAPHQDIIRALMSEHQTRVEDFRRRFEQYAATQESKRSSVSSGNKQASYLRLLTSSRRLLSEADTSGESRFAGSPQMRNVSRVEFPKVLMKDEHIAACETSPTLLDLRKLQDQFLHHALPHGNMLGLREQIQFVSFAQQQADWDRQQQQRGRRRPGTANMQAAEEPLEAKTRALLNGLRKLHPEDVEMAASATIVATPRSRDQPHAEFRFVSASS